VLIVLSGVFSSHPVVPPAEMFIGEDGHRGANRFEAVSAGLEETVARIHRLVVLVRRVVTMPAQHMHACKRGQSRQQQQ
jgi:hypothetical protein